MAGSYWAKRLQEQQDILYNKGLNAQKKQLTSYYKQAIADTQNDISKLYDQIQKESLNGEIKINDLYRYDRYFKVMNNLNSQLKTLGQKEIEIDTGSFKTLYNSVSKLVSDKLPNGLYNTFTADKAADSVLNSVWAADGKHWSNRVWSNKEELQKSIEKGMVDSFSRGVSKDQMVKQIKDTFASDFYKADRICRTELTNIQNQASADSYKQAGVEKYQVLAADDERTCDICSEMNGQIFRLDEMIVGVNCPPFHANDRCCIVPIIE